MIESPHVRLQLDDSGNLLVVVDDYEVYDYIEDHFVEKHGLEELWSTHSEGPPATYTSTYPGDHARRVREALAELDPAELHRIFLINNPEQGDTEGARKSGDPS